ncbi:MAG TPA: hypothetical protein VIL74_23195 [Pyrinomonadaceae bacterium]|jgi:hypothetical protein
MKPGADATTNQKTHHAIGLLSFAAALVTSAVTLALFIIAFVPDSHTYAARRLNKILFVFALMIAPIIHVAGLGLGIAGAFLKNSKKVFPILGIVLNALPLMLALLGWLFIILIAGAVLGSGGGWM